MSLQKLGASIFSNPGFIAACHAAFQVMIPKATKKQNESVNGKINAVVPYRIVTKAMTIDEIHVVMRDTLLKLYISFKRCFYLLRMATLPFEFSDFLKCRCSV